MSIKRVTIPSVYSLEGVLREGRPDRGVVIAHPHPLYGGSMLNNVVDAIEEGFALKGFTTLRFNFRGVGGSGGSYGDGEGETDDGEACLRYLKGRLSVDAEVMLAGYSFGAWISSRVAFRTGHRDGLFLVAYPFGFYGTEELSAYGGPIYFVGGTRDEIGPEADLLKLYESLATEDKYLKIIPTDHFYGGKEGEIMRFIEEQVHLDGQS
jgi:uncharacterized protein